MSRPKPCRPAILLLLALWLTGCSLAPPVPPAPEQPALADPATMKRRLTFQPDDPTRDPQMLIALLRLDGATLRAVLLTPYGQRLVTLVHDADGDRYQAGDLPLDTVTERLPPADWLAARLVWCLWPTDALREALAGSDWSVTVADGARIIRHRQRTIARITPADTRAGRDDTVLLDDRQGGYRLRIAPLTETAQ
ncbi:MULTISPECIES: DUF3261 domain-containing protein [unclassified Modicisalibacter]|uniref:DUF3261 domain-containing protein n=1 Tax=unclassified Modicisalibacter TaxID=2679913 RepID=UPI001CCC61DC|nr:DUF3261 domain-containing protein [Modicisalibacter sp. R2A 31.J]MBZ9575838.1 DUF3261 domain-containing protein [Modicisalibacter sp. MOD 31.J]